MSNWEFYIEPQSLSEYESKIKIFFPDMQNFQKHLPPVQLSSGSYHSKCYRSSEFTKKAKTETRAPFQKQQHNLQDETGDQMKIPESLLQIY